MLITMKIKRVVEVIAKPLWFFEHFLNWFIHDNSFFYHILDYVDTHEIEKRLTPALSSVVNQILLIQCLLPGQN